MVFKGRATLFTPLMKNFCPTILIACPDTHHWEKLKNFAKNHATCETWESFKAGSKSYETNFGIPFYLKAKNNCLVGQSIS